ncbi:MAG: hypothetical protein JXR73_07520 [Candidatus Omnitrophica bacterium]|nr:hypothetical protein [Candidatus Omnitrophota bacterium]
MALTDYGLLIIVLILGYWIFQLKLEIDRISDELDRKPPEPSSLSVHDMQMLQSSLVELVEEIEQYTESQMRKMAAQVQSIQILCQRLEKQIQERESSKAFSPPPPSSASTRVVPLSPKQNQANHKNHDRIIELHQKGWTPDKIAEELRITKGEVQLVVNLA